MKKVVVALILSTVSVSAIAQHSHGHGKPYEGQQERDIKALSEDEVKQYLAHRRLRPLLTDEQVARYDALRGYQ